MTKINTRKNTFFLLCR